MAAQRPGAVSSWVWIAAVAVALVAAVLLVYGFLLDRELPAPAAGDATIQRITANPNAFVGQTVTVDGQIARVIRPELFAIRDPQQAAGDELLVVLDRPSGDGLALREGQPVRVSGTVHIFDRSEIVHRFGSDIDEATLSALLNRPVVVAENVTPAGG